MKRVTERMFGPGSPLQVIGHRGAAAAAPENTLASIRHAIRVGARAIELDLHLSHCGRLVVIHDPTVNRTTDGEGEVARMDLGELRALDAGHGFTADGGRSYPFRSQGIRIPTLEEVLEETGDLPLITEVKSVPAGEALAAFLERSPHAERIMVGGFALRAVDPPRRAARWTCAYTSELRPYVLLGKVGMAGLAVPHVDALLVPERRQGLRIVTPRFIRRAHQDGFGVFVWTVNRAADARRLFDWGVDGLISDAPGRIRRILEERAAHGADGPQLAA